MTHGGAWLTVTGVLVSQANELFGASYQLYRHTETNDTIIRTVDYAIPAVLHTHIQAVAPTTHTHAAADTAQAFFRNSSVAGRGGVKEARKGAVDPRR